MSYSNPPQHYVRQTPSTVIRRIERRMTVNQIHELRDYVKFMERYSSEVTTLYRELLIGVTSFFRDREVFEELEENHLPALFKRIEDREIRFWIAGCSTGEEAYSLAILSHEVMEKIDKRIDIKIFATDIDRDAILRASNGLYPESVAVDLPPKLLTKYFHHRDEHYQIDRSIREMVVFAQHNLIKDPPFTNIELVSCRNLLIYLQPVLQRKAMELMNFSLNPQGILLLGSSETTGEAADLYEALHQKYKIYVSKGKRRPTSGPEFLSVPEMRSWQNRARSTNGPWPRNQDDERLLERFLQALAGDYVPLAVVVNEQLEVLHILGNADGYFRLPSGKLMNDVTKIAVRDLAIPLATGLQKVFKTGEELKYTSIRLQWNNESKSVQMRIRPLPGKKGQELLVAVFIEETAPLLKETASDEMQVYNVTEEAEQRINDLEQELQFSRENLQATIEELETSNEELQATNEELLASNEELQSTNEELQSVNEELHTVNAEYQSKIIELTEINNDLDNLMASTRIATLFLDENLAVRRFTPEIRRIFKILDSDLGRPANHLIHMVQVNLFELIDEVAQSGVEQEQEVRTQDGAWFLMRILPYQVGIGAVSGVVLTFIDIGLLKTIQHALLDSESRLTSLYRAAPVGIGRIVDRTFLEVNDQLCRMVGYTHEELIGRSSRLLYASQEEFEYVGKELHAQILEHGVGTVKSDWRRKNGSLFPVLISSAPLDAANPDEGTTFTVLDLSSSMRATEQIRASEERYRQLFNTMAEGVVYQNAYGEIIFANPAAASILGLPIDEIDGQVSLRYSWQAIYQDGSEFSDDQHPSMVALRTGQPVTDVVMGVFNPQRRQTRWLRVSAIPLFNPGEKKPFQVFATFNDITEMIGGMCELDRVRRGLESPGRGSISTSR
ncbi:MAG: PAS domain S-box protein [Gammaproteobacteria bacterium]|nr:PAS domain S-box protein [Gammaproteobacteria bacterium]